MNRFLKLVNYELLRFRYIYLSLLVVTLLLQVVGLYIFVEDRLSSINDTMESNFLSEAEYAATFPVVTITRYTDGSLWFLGPIVLCVAALLIYVFMIWYRDWMGKNMFIYRLMMLPTSRISIYMSKLSVIILAVLGLVAFQIIAIPLQLKLFEMWMPSEFRGPVSMSTAEIIITHPVLAILIPQTFTDFVFSYGAGVLGVMIVFTAILLERSYRWKGLIGGIVYGAVSCVVILLPLFYNEMFQMNFYYTEVMVMEIIAMILIATLSLWLSYYLLKNKVSV